MRALLLIPQLVAPVTKSSPAGMNVDESEETYWRAGFARASRFRRQSLDGSTATSPGRGATGCGANSVTSPSGESGLNV